MFVDDGTIVRHGDDDYAARQEQWAEHRDHAVREGRDRQSERGGLYVVCALCGYHYGPSAIGPDGACLDTKRCAGNQNTRRRFREEAAAIRKERRR